MRSTARQPTKRRAAAVLAVAMLLAAPLVCGSGPGTPDGAALQLFSAADREVVGRGVAFAVDVTLYATTAAPGDREQAAAAFDAGRFGPLPAGLRLVRAEAPVQRAERGDDGVPILVLQRRFLFRAFGTGVVEVPSWQMQFGARTYETAPHRLLTYDLRPGFDQASQSVLPVVAKSRTADGRRVFTRIGSAFLVAPDAVATAYHVIMDAVDVRVTLPDGRRLRLRRAWAIDPGRDVAILHIDPDVAARAGLRPLPLAPLDRTVASGEDAAGAAPGLQDEVVVTNGWPGGQRRATAGIHFPALTFEPGEAIWVSTNPVRPGDSGGPLLNTAGEVLGVISTGGVPEGRDEPSEELCVATDLRPALLRKLSAARPRSLRRMLNDRTFRSDPYVRAYRLATVVSIRYRVGEARELLRQIDEAVAALDPPDPGLRFVLASLHRALGTPVDPIARFRAATEASGRHHLPAVYTLARLLLREGAYAESERLFTELEAHPPYRYLAAYGRARILFARHRYEQAKALLLEVLRVDPGFAAGLYHLALCHLALGDEPRARQVLLQLDRLSPAYAHRLRQTLHVPAFRPVVLKALPRSVPSADRF